MVEEAGAIEMTFSVVGGIIGLGIIVAGAYSLVRCCCYKGKNQNVIKIANFQPVADTESNFKEIEVDGSSSRLTIINNYFKESRPINIDNSQSQ